MALAAAIFLVLLKVTAPYGKHTSTKWGPLIPNNLGWILMETPAMFVLMYFMIANASAQNAMTWVLVSFFMFHYLNRTFIFPFRIRTRGKKMPIVIVLMGFTFNLVNGFFFGYYFGNFSGRVNPDFIQPHIFLGVLMFVAGVYMNWDYDNRLIHLRRHGETNYVIPQGGLFKYISCPNLLGEIIEWTAYAILCWNLPAVSFLVWTAANLIPRALSHHRWYKKRFPDYPAERKAVFPFIA